MTPSERAKWCLEQADEAEASTPAADTDSEFRTPAQLEADWWRRMAFRAASQNGGGSA